MEQPIEGGILDTLKNLFNRIFKDIMSGFDDADFGKDKEEALDYSKNSDRPKSQDILKAMEDIPEEERQGMRQVYKHKKSPKDYGMYEIRYWDLGKSTKNKGKIAAEIIDAKSGKVIDTVLDKESRFNKTLKEKIDSLIEAEVAAHQPEEGSEDTSASSKVINLTLQRITGSDYVDYQLTDLSANCKLTIVKNALPEILELDDLYNNFSEGENTVSVELEDVGCIDDNNETKHILQLFFEETSRLYIYAYTYQFLHSQDLTMAQITNLLKDIMDQIGTDLAEDNLPVEFVDAYVYEECTDEMFFQLLCEYVQSYNDVICMILSYEKQNNYDVLMRQINFILENLDGSDCEIE